MSAVKIGAAVVSPDFGAGGGIAAEDEGAFERPNTGGEVNAALFGHRSAAHGPHGDEALIAEKQSIGWNGPFLPDLGAVGEFHATHTTIVGAEDGRFADNDGREAHGAICEGSPEFRAGVRVEGDDAIFTRTADKKSFSGHDGLVAAIELQTRLFEGRAQRRQLATPDEAGLRRHLLRRGSRAAGIVPPHGPIGGVRQSGEEKKDDKAWHGWL
jgi:hypothetical protein